MNSVKNFRRRVTAAGLAGALLAGALVVAPAVLTSASAAATCQAYGLQYSTSTKAINQTCSKVQARHSRYSGGIFYYDGVWSGGTSTGSGTNGTSAGGYMRINTGSAITGWQAV